MFVIFRKHSDAFLTHVVSDIRTTYYTHVFDILGSAGQNLRWMNEWSGSVLASRFIAQQYLAAKIDLGSFIARIRSLGSTSHPKLARLNLRAWRHPGGRLETWLP